MAINYDYLLNRVCPALESGNFTKVKGVLHSPDDRNCCLGVMCRLLVEDGTLTPPYLGQALYPGHAGTVPTLESGEAYHYGFDAYELPPKAKNFLGIDGCGSGLGRSPSGEVCALSSLNDSTDLTLPEIGAILRERLIELQAEESY